MTKFSAQQQSQLAQIGGFLREKREQQGKSLEDIAICTYIRPQLLNGIESGNPDLLPEPIFVQGFIRRYAENLGLQGIELSQQFSVDSIPSTPRPARQSEVEDSPTTRLTRASSAESAKAEGRVVTSGEPDAAAMFSAGSASPLEDSLIDKGERNAADERQNARQSTAEVPLIVDDAVLEMQQAQTEAIAENMFEASNAPASDAFSDDFSDDVEAEAADFSFSSVDISSIDADLDSESDFQSLIDRASASRMQSSDLDNSYLDNSNLYSSDLDSFTGATVGSSVSPDLSAADSSTADSLSSDFPTADIPRSEETFADKIAEFDRQNMNSTSEPFAPAASSSENSFDDDLPAAFSTAAAVPSTPANPYAEPAAMEAAPVSTQYERVEGPNLKPFIIGGIVAALLTAAVVAIASLFGGDRAPSVAETPNPTESAGSKLETVDSEPLPPVPAQPSKPPASTAPVYVEAEATSEAWVSVIADESGTPLFEGTLQPGDTAVWEGQQTVSVYSGDAGALKVSQNGEPADVMGERGQPEEKIFTLN